MKHKIALLSAAAACLVSVAPASAASLLFTVTGARTATFQLDSNPIPTNVIPTSPPFFIGDQIQFANVPGVFNGIAGTSNIGFGRGTSVASFQFSSPVFSQFSGAAIFTGAANAPVFAPGVFALNNPFLGNATLTITQVAAAVPEPATWMMMLLGFGLIGASMRYGRRTTTVTYA